MSASNGLLFGLHRHLVDHVSHGVDAISCWFALTCKWLCLSEIHCTWSSIWATEICFCWIGDARLFVAQWALSPSPYNVILWLLHNSIRASPQFSSHASSFAVQQSVSRWRLHASSWHSSLDLLRLPCPKPRWKISLTGLHLHNSPQISIEVSVFVKTPLGQNRGEGQGWTCAKYSTEEWSADDIHTQHKNNKKGASEE